MAVVVADRGSIVPNCAGGIGGGATRDIKDNCSPKSSPLTPPFIVGQ